MMQMNKKKKRKELQLLSHTSKYMFDVTVWIVNKIYLSSRKNEWMAFDWRMRERERAKDYQEKDPSVIVSVHENIWNKKDSKNTFIKYHKGKKSKYCIASKFVSLFNIFWNSINANCWKVNENWRFQTVFRSILNLW